MGDLGILLARRRRCDELVHLEEGTGRLGDLDAHPPASGEVAFEAAVVNRLIEDRRQAGGELADHRWAQRPDGATVAIPELGVSVERASQLGGLLDLLSP